MVIPASCILSIPLPFSSSYTIRKKKKYRLSCGDAHVILLFIPSEGMSAECCAVGRKGTQRTTRGVGTEPIQSCHSAWFTRHSCPGRCTFFRTTRSKSDALCIVEGTGSVEAVSLRCMGNAVQLVKAFRSNSSGDGPEEDEITGSCYVCLKATPVGRRACDTCNSNGVKSPGDQCAVPVTYQLQLVPEGDTRSPKLRKLTNASTVMKEPHSSSP